jgi:hypothetical protein
MSVVNQYKFYGKTSTAAETVTLLSPSANETVIIKSIRVTNKSSTNAPTVTIKNNTFEIINTQVLLVSSSVEILSLGSPVGFSSPLVVEGGTTLTYTTAGTLTDGVVFGISYLNILKERTD